ncbi:MAG: alpha/beta hydrolase, partial [Gammaproteobacteria bacterium]
MLSPPNHGSEVIDKLGDMPGFDWLNGPAGDQLGTEAGSVPNLLGKVDFE